MKDVLFIGGTGPSDLPADRRIASNLAIGQLVHLLVLLKSRAYQKKKHPRYLESDRRDLQEPQS
jgi:hypothetical protein